MKMNTEMRVTRHSQGMPANTTRWERHGTDSFLGPPEGMQPS